MDIELACIAVAVSAFVVDALRERKWRAFVVYLEIRQVNVTGVSNTTTAAVRRSTGRGTSPRFDVGGVLCVVERHVSSGDILDVLEGVIVLSDRSNSDAVSVIKDAIFHQDVSAVRFLRD